MICIPNGRPILYAYNRGLFLSYHWCLCESQLFVELANEMIQRSYRYYLCDCLPLVLLTAISSIYNASQKTTLSYYVSKGNPLKWNTCH